MRMEQLLGMQVGNSFLLAMEPLLSALLQNQIVGIDDRNNWNELQSNLCSVLIVSSRFQSLPYELTLG